LPIINFIDILYFRTVEYIYKLKMVTIMIFNIEFKQGIKGEIESFTVEAKNELEAISILGKYRGKRIVKNILTVNNLIMPRYNDYLALAVNKPLLE